MCRSQTIPTRSQDDAAGLLRGTDGDAINSALDRKITREDVVVVMEKRRNRRRREPLRIRRRCIDRCRLGGSLCNATSPLGWTTQCEVNHVESSGNATPTLVHHLDIDKRKVGAISAQTTWASVQRETDRSRRAGSLE